MNDPQNTVPAVFHPLRTTPADGRATEIYQDLVDQIDSRFWQRRWPSIMCHFAIPNALSSPHTARMIDSPDVFLDLLKSARYNFEAAGATDYHRPARLLCHARCDDHCAALCRICPDATHWNRVAGADDACGKT
jgi:hypothetical protein